MLSDICLYHWTVNAMRIGIISLIITTLIPSTNIETGPQQKQNDIFIIFHDFVFKLNVQYKNTVLPLLVLLSG